MGDRADRLSNRRKGRSQDDTSQSDTENKTDNTVKADDTEGTDGPSNTEEGSKSARLSQTTKEQMMHLPEDQHKRLHHLYTQMKADYEYEFDEAFELNRQYFPLILQYGLDQFEKRDAEEIRHDLVEFGDDSQ